MNAMKSFETYLMFRTQEVYSHSANGWTLVNEEKISANRIKLTFIKVILDEPSATHPEPYIRNRFKAVNARMMSAYNQEDRPDVKRSVNKEELTVTLPVYENADTDDN